MGKFAIVISACGSKEFVNAMRSSRVEVPALQTGLVDIFQINCCSTGNA